MKTRSFVVLGVSWAWAYVKSTSYYGSAEKSTVSASKPLGRFTRQVYKFKLRGQLISRIVVGILYYNIVMLVTSVLPVAYATESSGYLR